MHREIVRVTDGHIGLHNLKVQYCKKDGILHNEIVRQRERKPGAHNEIG